MQESNVELFPLPQVANETNKSHRFSQPLLLGTYTDGLDGYKQENELIYLFVIVPSD